MKIHVYHEGRSVLKLGPKVRQMCCQKVSKRSSMLLIDITNLQSVVYARRVESRREREQNHAHLEPRVGEWVVPQEHFGNISKRLAEASQEHGHAEEPCLALDALVGVGYAGEGENDEEYDCSCEAGSIAVDGS